MAASLYSPLDFIRGLEVRLAGRAQISLSQAWQEAEREQPRWAYRLGASLLTGLGILFLLRTVLPKVAPTVMSTVSSRTEGRTLLACVAASVMAAAAWAIFRLLKRGWVFYADTCALGAADRLQQHPEASQ